MSTEADATILGTAPREGSKDDLPVGTLVGEYRIEGVIGEGGFGTVYRVIHPIIGKTAAIKVLKRELSSNGEMVSRFIAEARAVNQIRHRNIIDIFAFGVLPDGRHYYVMEFLEGVSLETHLRSHGGRLAVADALAILRPLARALHAAHARGIAHRDIKPENVLLTFGDEGETLPKLLDFGIAKLAGDGASKHRTAPGVQMGTPAYMAPEQVHGKPSDYRADIYTFGAMVFEILTGRLPFDGHSAMDVMIKHVSAPAPHMSQTAQDLPPELDAPVLHMMAKEPDERPSSLLEAIDALVEGAERAGVIPRDRFAKLGSGEASALGAKGPTPSGFSHAPNQNPSFAAAQSARGPSGASAQRSSSFSSGADKVTTTSSSKRSWLLVVAGLVAACLAVFLIATLARTKPQDGAASRGKDESAAPTAAATTAPPSASTPAVAPVVSSAPAIESASAALPSPNIKLTIAATPADADIYLGSKKLGSATEALELPRGTKSVKLIVQRKGYLPKIVEVVPDRDIELKAALQPAPQKDYTF
ncbi:MAG: serine/threonine protein kinase [Polyangiaceae bacterium]|nr:serine/threonine protein kinase [Polyangiaceae bacterium]